MEEDFNMNYYEKIKNLAEQKGYTLHALAKDAGISESTYYYLKKRDPGMKVLVKTAQTLGISLSELTEGKFTDVDDMHNLTQSQILKINEEVRDYRAFLIQKAQLELD